MQEREKEKIETLLRGIRQDLVWLACLICAAMILQLILHFSFEWSWSCLKTR